MALHSYPLPSPGLALPIAEFRSDWDALGRRYRLRFSSQGFSSRRKCLGRWNDWIADLPYAELDRAAKFDVHLLRNHLARLENDLSRLERERVRIFAAFPFSLALTELDEEREAMETPAPEMVARTLATVAGQIVEAKAPAGDAPAQAWIGELLEAVDRWRKRHLGFDPLMTFWAKKPLEAVESGLRKLLEQAQIADQSGGEIPGRALGREELLKDLEFEFIPYTPEELIAIGDREYEWCLAEMKKAAKELGFGEDWRSAIEYVKDTAVPVGQQAAVVRDLAQEAVTYLEEHDLVTIPDLAKEVWRMEMMSAEAQKTNPFFLGGEAIIVSYPTDEMSDREKRMSMRGNNPNFSRATVQHELIPGHHLQMFMADRFRSYRQIFSTPFWIEGWTIYWELLLWDLGFPRTPEERIGMLFWRMHRCARISFSIRFHLGELTTEECVQILTDRVGHERANAEGEVRRSFNGLYPPLYQAAYMIGGLQVMAMRRELVEGGKMTAKAFHDAFLRENDIPVAILRNILSGEEPPENATFEWRFDPVA